MSNNELAELLQRELKRRCWSIPDLAKHAGMNYETVRRAVKGIGQASLDTANKLLATVGHDLAVEEHAEKSTPLEPETTA